MKIESLRQLIELKDEIILVLDNDCTYIRSKTDDSKEYYWDMTYNRPEDLLKDALRIFGIEYENC